MLICNYLFATNGLTVCVTGAGAGVDSVWEQEKPEARKMLENAAESHTSGARFVRRTHGTQDSPPETKHHCILEITINLYLIGKAQSYCQKLYDTW
jgi:hypothetical protein